MKHRLPRPRLLRAAPLAAALLAVPLHSQEAADVAGAPASDAPFVETVNVEVVNIDVYVTDADGNTVQDLTRDDFELYVGGKRVPISNFYAVVSGLRRVETAVAAPEGDAPPEPAAVEEPAAPQPEAAPGPPPPDQQLHVVVYVDNYNLTPFNRNKVLNELRVFLRDELGPNDQVMLTSYDRSLHLREPFSARAENVTRAMLELEDLSAQRIHLDRERVDIFRRIEDADTVTEAIGIARTFAASVRNDVSFTIDALRWIVDGLAGSPGRKAVLYVSEGLPMIPGEDVFYAVQQKFKEEMSLNEIGEYDMSRRFQELANQANANRVSFYTIDARGLTVLSQGTVDYDIAGEPGERTFFDSILRSNTQSTLQMLAERTGGRAIINANRILPDLQKVSQDFRNYYSLGYLLPEQVDGRLRQVEVKLTNPRRGWQVRHQYGFRAKSLESKMHDGTLSALHLDLQDNVIGARILIGRPTLRDSGLYDVPLALSIPYDNLLLLPQDGRNVGRLRVWFAAKDQDDEMSDVQQIPVEIELSDEDLEQRKGEDFVYPFQLMMEEGYHDLAIGLHDQLGGRTAFLRRGIPVGGGRRSGG
ncbi:MAG TPA: VWA domain-containing protein [Thermoanaerobaculia bacterium]|nr:VWA domain-containing protein [Thermoanaerobaculia bacterium]